MIKKILMYGSLACLFCAFLSYFVQTTAAGAEATQSSLDELEEHIALIYSQAADALVALHTTDPSITIEQIKQEVSSQIDKKLLAEKLSFFAGVRPDNEMTIPRIATIVESMITAAFESLFIPEEDRLYWCMCIHPVHRIMFNLKVLLATLKKYQHADAQIIYTAFAPGDLLQEYTLVSSLLEFYPHIAVNLIDLGYPDFSDLPKLNPKLSSRHKELSLSIKSIEQFRIKIASQISLLEQDNRQKYYFKLNVYNSTLEYIAKVEKTDEKADIITMVDPDLGFFGSTSYPSEANMITFWPVHTDNVRPLILFLDNKSAYLYQSDNTLSDSKTNQLAHEISALITASKSKNKLITSLLGKSILPEVSTQKSREELLSSALAAKGISILPIIQKWLKTLDTVAIEIEEARPTSSSFDALELGENIVLVSFAMDAHITFKKLILTCLKPDGLAFALYKIIDTKNEMILASEQITSDYYTQHDIVTAIAGRFLETPDSEVQVTYKEYAVPNLYASPYLYITPYLSEEDEEISDAPVYKRIATIGLDTELLKSSPRKPGENKSAIKTVVPPTVTKGLLSKFLHRSNPSISPEEETATADALK